MNQLQDVEFYQKYSDDFYNDFLEHSKYIFNKYKTECNPKNKRLLFITDECVFEDKMMHGGYECGDDGKWTKKCIPSYCDNGYDYDERLHGLCDSFDNFYSLLSKSGDTEFIDREKYLYLKVQDPETNEDMYVYGRFDALFRNKRTNKYILIDWKSSGTIDKIPNRWTKKMLGPMYKYPQLNWYRYTLQLYFYKMALLKSGYVPEGTSPDDIIVMIVNLPGKNIQEVNRNYQTHNPAMPYDEKELNEFFKFAIQKFNLLKKEEKETEEDSQTFMKQVEKVKEDTAENIF